jgi:histidine triad (HIT) family protein
MSDCLFCKIIAGQIQGRFVYEDHELVAIRDIDPQAPLHALIIPRRHISTLNELGPHDDALVGSMLRRAPSWRRSTVIEAGYHGVNTNREAGQTSHIHPHLPEGRGLTWPPG